MTYTKAELHWFFAHFFGLYACARQHGIDCMRWELGRDALISLHKRHPRCPILYSLPVELNDKIVSDRAILIDRKQKTVGFIKVPQ